MKYWIVSAVQGSLKAHGAMILIIGSVLHSGQKGGRLAFFA